MTCRCWTRGLWLVGLWVCGMWQVVTAQDSETVCAVVKIEIRQELTLERQAFDAHMRITNGLETLSLENVNVNVTFQDEEGNAVLASSDPDNTDASFFIRIDRMDGITDVSGSGQILPGQVADIHWLIIPSPGAGGQTPSGELYAVGASLSYNFGGESETVDVTPDFIQVKPMPILDLDYFLPSKVYADDPLTAEVESVVPFPLGLRISNAGAGDAHKLKIESAQPEIIDNEQGLLIGFEILGTSVNDSPVEDSLLADFGTLPAGESAVARWIMTSSLSGEFIGFSADFVHSDELGGQLTSLIESVETHLIVHDVVVGLAGRDEVTDFLAREGASYRVYESQGTDAAVVDASESVSFVSAASKSSGNGTDPKVLETRTYELDFDAPSGPVFVRWPDPTDGQLSQIAAFRSDGKLLDSRNVWSFPEDDANGNRGYYLGLFDVNSTGSYELRFKADIPDNRPPELTAPDTLEIQAGQTGSFTATTLEPDGDTVTISASGVPEGASFSDNGDGSADFKWIPTWLQVGEYSVVVTASDGELTDTATVAVTVVPDPDGDSDNDGMKDEWEAAHFGDISRDGSGDFDLDSATDLEEHDFGGDPTVEDRPTAPVVLEPNSVTISTETPELRIQNSLSADAADLSYRFELFKAGRPGTLVETVELAETPLETAWQIAAGLLEENTQYQWRARGFDGATLSPWAYGEFWFSAVEEAPAECAASHPGHQAVVSQNRPTLAVIGGADPDGADVDKRFVVYRDAGLTEIAADSGWIESQGDLVHRWVPYVRLLDGQTYYWQASISDDAGTVVDCGVSALTINLSAAQPNGYMATESTLADGWNLVAENVQYDGNGSLEAEFQVATDPLFHSTVESSDPVAVTDGSASWKAIGVQEDTEYHWRVRVGDGMVHGPWIYRSAVFSANDAAPPTPVVQNFAGPTWVATLAPGLSVATPYNAERDHSHYAFEIFESPEGSVPVESGTSTSGEFVVANLTDRRYYYWRAVSVDESGQESLPSPLTSFYTIDDQIDAVPQFVFVGLNEPSSRRRDDIRVQWRDHDPDSDASISLYWDRNAAGANGTLIADGISEDDSADTYHWNATGIEASKVYLYAVISDGSSQAVTYANAPIWLESATLEVSTLDAVTAETGDEGRVAIRLGAMPEDYVLIRASVSDDSEAEVSPRELLFTPRDWDQARQLVLTGLDDELADGDVEYAMDISAESADTGYNGETASQAMHNLDDDVAGFFVEANEPVLVSELGDGSSVDITLRTRPEAPVELTAVVSDGTEAGVAPATLVFTPDNWDQAQGFVVTGLDDSVIDDDVGFDLGFEPAVSDDAAYSGITPSPVSAVNLDDDAPYIGVDPTDGLVTTEEGTTAEFDVWLSAEPSAEVVVDIRSDDESEGAVSLDRLTFNATNWRQPQTVEVSGVPDSVDDGDQPYEVILSPAVSDDPHYDGLDPEDVQVLNRQDQSWYIEVGSVPLSGSGDGFFQVSFDQTFGFPPVVISQLDGLGDGRFVRIRNVSETGFEAVVLDPMDAGESLDELTLQYLAVTPGVHELPSGHLLEAGTVFTDAAVGGVTQEWQPVALTGELDSPLAFAGIQTFNTPVGTPADSSVTWFDIAMGEVTPGRLDVALEAAHLNPSMVTFGAEQIGYVALEDGAEGWLQSPGGGVRFLADRVPHPVSQGCKRQSLVQGGLEDVVVLRQAFERGEVGGLLTECDRGNGFVGYQYFTGGRDATTTVARLVVESGFSAHLDAEPAGLVLDKAFNLRVFEDGRPGLLGVSLSREPSAPVSVTLQSEHLSLAPASLDLDASNWQETQWVRYEADNDGQPIGPVTDHLIFGLESGDGDFAKLEPVAAPVLVAGPLDWRSHVDNEDAAFSVTGTWPESAAYEGYLGKNYQRHAPNGPSPVFTQVDNSDPEFSTFGTWPTSTAGAGYIGPDYAAHEPNGLRPGSVVLDDDQASFTHHWPEKTNRVGYVGDHFHFHAPSQRYADASWNLSAIDSDRYDVYANWTAFRNHASNAPYEIVDSDGSLHVIRVDQRDDGGTWQLLGTFDLDPDSVVRLTNEADGHVIADAILLVPADAPPNTAIWEPTIPESGGHRVFAHWTADDSHATNATYVVHHRDGVAEVTVDQRKAGGQWNLLGTFPFETGARVELTDVADGRVVADAVKFEHVNAPPNEAIWRTSVFTVGDFEAYARWADHPGRATNAQYQLHNGFGVEEIREDQTQEAGRWAYLGTVRMVPGLQGDIILNDRADGNVVADAVRLVDKRAAGARGVRIFDDPLGRIDGEWRHEAVAAGFWGAGYQTHAAGAGEASFSWSLTPYRAGAHRVYVRWTSGSDRASDAPYTVNHADGQETIRIDQRTGGGQWRLLGEYTLDSDSTLILGNDADGEVVADAVRIVPARYPEEQ